LLLPSTAISLRH
ncbi:type II secretion system (T2SS), F family protein, partial [Vibrio parahaemolyticus V-223/04]